MRVIKKASADADTKKVIASITRAPFIPMVFTKLTPTNGPAIFITSIPPFDIELYIPMRSLSITFFTIDLYVGELNAYTNAKSAFVAISI